jgi:hypothetical protein
MTITIFIVMLTIGSSVSSLLVQALKKHAENRGKTCSPNLIALICTVVIGVAGTSIMYVLADVPWNLKNIMCMLLMVLCTWIGSMIGYDKVIQTIVQINNGSSNSKPTEKVETSNKEEASK